MFIIDPAGWAWCYLHKMYTITGKRSAEADPRMTYLCWSSVHHGRWEDGHDGGGGVQHALLEHSGMLLHAPVQRHVVLLGPAPQRVEEQDRVLVAALQQATLGVLHQQGVPVVDRVAQLEGKDGIWQERSQKVNINGQPTQHL